MEIAPGAGSRVCCMAALAVLCAAAAGQAPLRPSAVAYDGAGNAYFADTDRNQVYEATLAGGLIVVAGNGTQGFAGDGGAAAAAELSAPQGVAIGAAGELYIADTGNQRIRVASAGTITTFAGTGARGFSGDGGAATAASFNTPTALAMDSSGALLVCDTENHRVRKISSGVIATIAGNGTQGFAGDGGAATAAAVDAPRGVAVSADGRVFVADSRNHRIRVISTSGVITSYAGTGVRGYAGDGGAATAAELDLPRGLVVLADGTLVVADSDNRRVRAISAAGVISTLAGAGTQGASSDGTAAMNAWLNAPRAVAVDSFGNVTLADSANRSVQVKGSNAGLYSVAGLTPARTSSVTLVGPATATYGQWSGQVSVSGSASTPLGAVRLLDQATQAATGTLNAGTASFMPPALAAGQHSLSATYGGDGIDPAAASTSLAVTISPAPVTATANVATVLYGQAIPALTGTLNGVLSQDAGSVAADFSTQAAILSPVGTYPITAVLTGAAAGNYALASSTASGQLTITQASSTTSEPAQATGSYAGLPLALRAVVGSTTRGTPTGTVNFVENGATVAQGTLTGGLASASYTAPVTGTHSIVAAYAGDANFTPSASAAQSYVVLALPDFTLASSGASSQTIAGGSIATYALLVGAQSSPFTGAVSMSVSGLPLGATASFAPPLVVPGASGASVTLSITTIARTELRPPFTDRRRSPVWAMVVLAGMFSLRRRGRRLWPRRGALAAGFALCGVVSVTGCGSRTVLPATASSSTYNLTVTGTATNLAGAIVTHTTPLVLVVD